MKESNLFKKLAKIESDKLKNQLDGRTDEIDHLSPI